MYQHIYILFFRFAAGCQPKLFLLNCFVCHLCSPRCQHICVPPRFLWRFLRKWRRAQRERHSLSLAPAGKNAAANARVLITTRGTRPDPHRRKEKKSVSGRVSLGWKALLKSNQSVSCESGEEPGKITHVIISTGSSFSVFVPLC